MYRYLYIFIYLYLFIYNNMTQIYFPFPFYPFSRIHHFVHVIMFHISVIIFHHCFISAPPSSSSQTHFPAIPPPIHLFNNCAVNNNLYLKLAWLGLQRRHDERNNKPSRSATF